MNQDSHTMSNTSDRAAGASSGIKDISLFVENYKSLLDKLYPVFVVWDGVLYISRWENYILTLAVILVSSILFYFPSVLFSLLTLAAIIFMGIGRYHGHTKEIIALRKPPPIELLNPDQQALKRQHSEQGHMHKSRLHFRKILSDAETLMLKAGKIVDYIYSVYLWKSTEVSLCVTVLLCIVLVLLCTVDLRTIGATIPAIVLLTNKHFFSRSIDLWKQLLSRLKQRLDKRKNSPSSTTQSQHSSHDELEREGEEEGEMAATAAEHTPTQQSEVQDSNESGYSEPGMTPELRHRTIQSSSEPTQSTAVTVGGSARESVPSSETENSVPVSEGLITTRKDGKGPQHELCSKCQTSFFLKRKHDCNMCGQTFCGSCTVKVKRAALGATTPSAFETTVRVCLNCKVQLDDYTCSKE